MSAMGESPPEEDPAVTSAIRDDPSKDISDAETEPAMLDEEEMPSYISLTSLPLTEENRADRQVSQIREETTADEERPSSPYQSEQGADSVCVLSSGEESDRRTCEMPEDYDSDDMDMEDVEEEEDDDDEEEDDSCMNDAEEVDDEEEEEEEDSDGDIEPEQFERSSDDFVLRYDGGLEKHHKERSRSLQDLTNSRGNLSRFVGKRRSIDLMGSGEPEFSRQTVQRSLDDPLQTRKKMPRSVKYDHVSSKVKLYIQEMKEQRRRSAERLNRQRSPVRKKFSDANSRGDSADVSRNRLNPASRMIKNYVQNAINEMETNATLSNNVETENYRDQRSFDDVAKITTISKVEEIQEMDVIENDSTSNVANEKISVNLENPAKKHKSNGLVDYTEIVKNSETSEIPDSNGQEEIAAILNLRSLSYEEYTNGDEAVKSIVENLSMPKIPDNDEIAEYQEDIVIPRSEEELQKASFNATKTDDKIRQILPDELSNSRDSWNLRELTFEETSRRKTAQVDREVYQKMLDENMSLKVELEEMRKTLEKCREESNKPIEEYQRTRVENISLKRDLREITKKFEEYRASNVPALTKVAAVQTEHLEVEKIQTNIDETKQNSLTSKVLLSSSVTSALSSIEQWTDSNCSPAVSIDPPNIENALNSDDSLVTPGEKGPTAKNMRQLSHSFVTSSRILQTLANFTQGSVKTTESNSPSNASRNITQSGSSSSSIEKKGQSNKRPAYDGILSINDDANTTRAKKRKASDMLGISVNSESFKIPHTPVDTRRKMSTDSAADGALKNLEERPGSAKMTNEKMEKISDDSNERRNVDTDDNDNSDLPKNVKCFVYHDEPGSKERSFLIKADDSTNNTETLDKDGNVRECGPFLLGNVEIRMSEVNGTINIWGKEINQTTDDTEIDADMDVSESNERSPYIPRSPFVCQSTPHTKCQNVNASVYSSSKKPRISPKFSRSGIGKYLRSAATNMTRTNALGNAGHSVKCSNSMLLDNERIINDCEHCEIHRKPVKSSNCEHIVNSRIKQHSCCLHNPEINEKNCDCIDDNEINDDSTIFETVSNILANHDICTNLSNIPTSKRFFANIPNEDSCRNHQTTNCRRSSLLRDDELQRTKKRCSNCSVDANSYGTRLTPGDHNCRANAAAASRSQSHVSCEDDDHPLLSNETHCETPETKRRRLSGKKVRGILTDLLRGCGGCRETNSMSNLSRAKSQNVSPRVHTANFSPSQPSCSKRTNSCPSQSRRSSKEEVFNERCCNTCSRRAEMEAQMEDQLEIFLAATEQLRSRTDAVLEMLHMMKADTD